MARPSSFDRDEAIERAMQEFWRSGYEANSVKAMSEKLGITRSSFYNAFGSREALFKQALKTYAEQSSDSVFFQVEPPVSVKRLLTRTLREVCRIRAADHEARGCLIVNSVAELAGDDTDLGCFLTDAVNGRRAQLEDLFRLAVARGELPAGTDIHAIALTFQTLVIGLNTLSKVVRDEDELWLAAGTMLAGLGLYEEDDDA